MQLKGFLTILLCECLYINTFLKSKNNYIMILIRASKNVISDAQ